MQHSQLPVQRRSIDQDSSLLQSCIVGVSLTGHEDTLNRERQECLAAIAARIRVVIAHFRDSTACQNFDCSATRYGALLKELHRRNIVLEQLEQGGDGYSVTEVLQVLRSFREPDLAVGGPHNCGAVKTLRDSMASITVRDMTL